MFAFLEKFNKYLQDRRYKPIAYSEIAYPYDRSRDMVYNITFFENNKKKRKYIVRSNNIYYFPYTKLCQQCTMWKDSGILPDWATEIGNLGAPSDLIDR